MPVVPPAIIDVPNLSELNVRASPLSQVNIGGAIAPGYASYIDILMVSSSMQGVFKADGTVDGGLLFDIYNSKGHIADFIKPGHDEWLNRDIWVSQVRTIHDFMRYIFGVTDIQYNSSADSYSLVKDESSAVVNNDTDYHGILRRSISYQFKVGEGETILFVKGNTLDYFGGIVVGFNDERKLKKALGDGSFALYKLEVDGSVLPVDLKWYEQEGVERSKYVTVTNMNGEMEILNSEEIPLSPGASKGAMFNAGISAGAVFRRFVFESHFYASLGMVGTKVTTPSYRVKSRALLIADRHMVPEGIVTYDNTTKEWLVEAGLYLPTPFAMLSGSAVIGPFKPSDLRSGLEYPKTVKIGAFVPLTNWFAVQGHVQVGGKHITAEDLEVHGDAALRFRSEPFTAAFTVMRDPFTKRLMYGIEVGAEFKFPEKKGN